MKNFLLTAAVSMVASQALAQSQATITMSNYWNHRQNLTIGYGTAIMVAGGRDVNQWLAVDSYNWCDGIILESSTSTRPLPLPPRKDEELPAPDPFECAWDVTVTLGYELEVCPDGQAFIKRHGYGVTLETKTTGNEYEWSEEIYCSEWPFDGATDPLDTSRPLNLKSIKKAYR